jgi:hypothetical protein
MKSFLLKVLIVFLSLFTLYNITIGADLKYFKAEYNRLKSIIDLENKETADLIKKKIKKELKKN